MRESFPGSFLEPAHHPADDWQPFIKHGTQVEIIPMEIDPTIKMLGRGRYRPGEHTGATWLPPASARLVPPLRPGGPAGRIVSERSLRSRNLAGGNCCLTGCFHRILLPLNHHPSHNESSLIQGRMAIFDESVLRVALLKSPFPFVRHSGLTSKLTSGMFTS